MNAHRLFALLAAVLSGCSGTGELPRHDDTFPENVVPHSEWHDHEPPGIAADGVRRNLAPGDSVAVGNLTVRLDSMRPSRSSSGPDSVGLTVTSGGSSELVASAEGQAITRGGYRIAILAAHTDPDELGSGKTEIEIGELADLPDAIANSSAAGGPNMRLRIPHKILMVTLHHSGSAEPLRPEDDVALKIRELQLWSESDRNWWDVPYHFLIGLDGTIYQGRDYRYRGETNTRYDVDGHLLISVLGNYDLQESTDEQIEAITDLMAWAVAEFDIPLDKIYGHSDLAATSCPGKHLRKYLDDGTFRSGIAERIKALPGQ